ncbi:MAG TPA: serine/threonine-protein kinase [Polyangiaceae bacterium]|jgi:serine/threonine-protein kinase
MKSCPVCQRTFPNDAGFCPADGTPLTAASMAPVAPNADDARIGARLCGRYEIRRVVADGGMGRVYEGIDKQTDSRIAVKVLHEDVSKDDVALERFKREYEISALLPHEHIVQVLDFQRDPISKTWLLVMEFLDGEELRYILKREKVLPPERLVRMLSHVAIGLDGAHARSFIHRDLKPDNLFLCGTREGDNVKLLDFGSVKDQSGGNRKKLTVLGTTIGSPYYMSPEQAQGLDTIDARADVFALGAVTYECITGEVPFTGNNGPSILLAIMTKEPTPPSVKAAGAKYPVPPALDDVLEEALAKNQNIRTKSVGALADAVGHAYGLEGDHLQWALTPQQDLARRIAEAMPRSMQPKVAPLGVAVDPFAAPPTAGTMPMAQSPGPQQQNVDYPFQGGLREAELEAAGVPSGKPGWLLPVIVGLLALVVGGAVTLVVMMH